MNAAEQKVDESSENDSESVLRRLSSVNVDQIILNDEGNATEIERPVTLDDLRRLAHAPIDPLEDRVR